MSKNLKKPWSFWLKEFSSLKKIGPYLLGTLLLINLAGILSLFESKIQEVEADFELSQESISEISSFITIQENTLLPISSPFSSEKDPIVIDQIPAIITAYSSTPCQTDSDPYITAAGTWVRDGVIANNILPFGTKVRLPEIFGDKIFVVEDRMHWRKGDNQFDIWMDSYDQAKNFGVKRTYIEILEM